MEYNLTEIKTQVAERMGKTDSVFLGKIEDWVNGRYHQILKAVKWKDLLRSDTVTATANQDYLILPQDLAQLINIHDRTNDKNLTPINPSIGGRMFADVLDSEAVPNSYWIEETTVLNQPTSASTITAVSSEAADTSQTLRMRGRTASGENQATVTLNGTSSVNLLASCTQVDQVMKDAATAGFVTILADAGATTVAVIYPRNLTAKYKKLHLVKKPETALTYNIVYKKRLPRLEFAEDIPVLDCWNALVIGAYADALKQKRQFSKAQMEEQRYESLVADLVAEQFQQAEEVPQFIPHIQRDAIDMEQTF